MEITVPKFIPRDPLLEKLPSERVCIVNCSTQFSDYPVQGLGFRVWDLESWAPAGTCHL